MMGKRLRPAMTSDKKIGSLIAIVLLVALYVFLFMLDNALPSNSTTVMLITVLKKGAIYALVCVSMNLLNGFTGLSAHPGGGRGPGRRPPLPGIA